MVGDDEGGAAARKGKREQWFRLLDRPLPSDGELWNGRTQTSMSYGPSRWWTGKLAPLAGRNKG